MASLQEFRQKLEGLVPKGSSLWPFACDGSPLERRGKIFIVGINPARQLPKEFWEYWTDSTGFRKDKFLGDLERLDGGLTRTRKKIEAIANEVGQENVLDTNIYPVPAERPENIPEQQRQTKVLRFLLREIRPKIVLAHGIRDTVTWFQNCCDGFVVDRENLQDIVLDDLQFQILCSDHLWTPRVSPAAVSQMLKRALQQGGDA